MSISATYPGHVLKFVTYRVHSAAKQAVTGGTVANELRRRGDENSSISLE